MIGIAPKATDGIFGNPGGTLGDVNFDGRVDMADAGIALLSWGLRCKDV